AGTSHRTAADPDEHGASRHFPDVRPARPRCAAGNAELVHDAFRRRDRRRRRPAGSFPRQGHGEWQACRRAKGCQGGACSPGPCDQRPAPCGQRASMSLADRIDALRRQRQQRQAAARAPSPPIRAPLHEGGRYARWHVDTQVESESESWLLTYLDLLTLLLAMLVVLLGVSQLPSRAPAASLPVQLLGLLASPAGAANAAQTPPGDMTALLPMPDLPGLSAARETFAPLSGLAGIPQPAPAAEPAATPDAPASPAEPAPPEPQPPSIAELGLDGLGNDVDVIVNEKSISFRISNELLFPSGQAMLSPNGLRVIARMAGVINRSQGHPVSVEGHSDPVPIQTRQFPSNWELSAGRATSVLRELVRGGVDPARLRAVGYADTRPIAPNDTAAGRAANRRVELIMEITPRTDATKAREANKPPQG